MLALESQSAFRLIKSYIPGLTRAFPTCFVPAHLAQVQTLKFPLLRNEGFAYGVSLGKGHPLGSMRDVFVHDEVEDAFIVI